MSYQIGTAIQPTPIYSIQPELLIYLRRCGGNPSITWMNALNTLIVDLKAAGIWQKLDAFYPLNSESGLPAIKNLIKQKYDGSSTPENQAAHIPGYGIQGDGSTVFVNTNCFLAQVESQGGNYKAGSASMFVWSLSDFSSATSIEIGAQASSSQGRAAIRVKSGAYGYVWPNTISSLQIPVSTGLGFIGYSRVDSQNVYTCKNDSVVLNTGITEDPLPTFSPVFLFNLGYSSVGMSPDQLALAMFGGGLTSSECNTLYQICLQYLVTCGTVTGDIIPEPENPLPACFTPTTIDQVKAINGTNFRVYQQAPPPASNSTNENTYVYFPVSDAATQQIDKVVSSTATKVSGHHWFWHMRSAFSCDPNQPLRNNRPNPLPPGPSNLILRRLGYDCRARYSSLTKANAATEAMIRFSLGYQPHTGSTNPMLKGYLDIANEAGYADSDVYLWTDANTNKDTLFPDLFKSQLGTYYVSMDKIILPAARISDSTRGTGIVLDAEAQDNRSPADLLAQVQLYAQLCAYSNKEFLVYANPLDNAGARWTGFSVDNLYLMNQTPNLFLCTLVYKSDPDPLALQLSKQEALLKGPLGDQTIQWNKIIMSVGIGPGSPVFNSSQCATIRDYILSKGMLGLMVWRLYGTPGGSLSRYYNQVLASILGLPTS